MIFSEQVRNNQSNDNNYKYDIAIYDNLPYYFI